MSTQEPDHYIDITADVCPMTFVKSKLAYERAKTSEVVEIRLKGEEPRKNVPRALVEAGAELLSSVEAGDDEVILRIRKAADAK